MSSLYQAGHYQHVCIDQHIPDPPQRFYNIISQQVLLFIVSGYAGLACCEVFAQVRQAPDQRREQKCSSLAETESPDELSGNCGLLQEGQTLQHF